MYKSQFENLCYDLYKIEWLSEHISKECLRETVKDYYRDLPFEDPDYSLEDYLADNAFYNKQCYACKDEFLENEFQDPEYMQELLSEQGLINEYEKYMRLHRKR